MSETLTIRLSDELAEALRREARESGLPQGEIVRHALAARLHGAPAMSTMSRHFGVIRGPVDLSTGKVYRRARRKKETG